MDSSQGMVNALSVNGVHSCRVKSDCHRALTWLYGTLASACFFLSGATAAATSNLSCQANEADSSAQSPINPVSVSRLAISDAQLERCGKPDNAIKRLIQSKHVHIVDVRPSESYRRLHLSDSLNIPEHSIKVKGFLKDRPLLLVGDGHNDLQLFNTCLSLLHAGFKDVAVMEGGIMRWYSSLNREQTEITQPTLPKVDPREAFVALREGQWIIVTALGPESKRGLEVQALFPEQSIITIDQIIDQKDEITDKSKYLIIGENENTYKQIAERLLNSSRETSATYWLDGGISEYSRFVNNRALLLARLRRGPPKQAGCGTL